MIILATAVSAAAAAAAAAYAPYVRMTSLSSEEATRQTLCSDYIENDLVFLLHAWLMTDSLEWSPADSLQRVHHVIGITSTHCGLRSSRLKVLICA